eukprot:scaffold58606_cov64-Phaeocystis_antarctica.AAC.4
MEAALFRPADPALVRDAAEGRQQRQHRAGEEQHVASQHHVVLGVWQRRVVRLIAPQQLRHRRHRSVGRRSVARKRAVRVSAVCTRGVRAPDGRDAIALSAVNGTNVELQKDAWSESVTCAKPRAAAARPAAPVPEPSSISRSVPTVLDGTAMAAASPSAADGTAGAPSPCASKYWIRRREAPQTAPPEPTSVPDHWRSQSVVVPARTCVDRFSVGALNVKTVQKSDIWWRSLARNVAEVGSARDDACRAPPEPENAARARRARIRGSDRGKGL